MHSVGLGTRYAFEYTTQADLKDLYDILVENGIHLELPEVSIAVKDQLVHENYT
jgi:hypothetical protein